MFISLFKIWLITLYLVLFRSRLSDACQPGDIGTGSGACFHSYSFARGNVLNRHRSVPVRSVFISPPGTVSLSGNGSNCHFVHYVRNHMWTPELSGSVFPMYSSDDLVPHCGLSPWITARPACWIQLWGKASFIVPVPSESCSPLKSPFLKM